MCQSSGCEPHYFACQDDAPHYSERSSIHPHDKGGNPPFAIISLRKKTYPIILNYYNIACFIAHVMLQRKLAITVAGIRTLAEALNEHSRV